MLMAPGVGGTIARLLLGQDGWHIVNLTAKNVVRVNGRPVPSGSSLPIQPQDVLILGSTMLQLIAPQTVRLTNLDMSDHQDQADEIAEIYTAQPDLQIAYSNRVSVEQERLTPPALQALSSPPLQPLVPTSPVQPNDQARPAVGSFDTRESSGGPPAQFLLPAQADPEQEAQVWEEGAENG